MSNCTTCKNAVFDAWWGEHKCKIKQHVIFAGEGKDTPCTQYENGMPKDSVKNKHYINKEESNT